jgi:glycosyltransferase involved in cell wall biosynthesis
MRILFVVHGFPPGASGGTEIYAHDLARELARSGEDEVFVLAREADASRPERTVRRERRDGIDVTLVNNTFRECRSFEETYRNGRIRAIAARLLDEIRPDVCHVHHLTCLSTDIVDELADRGIPVVVTLNDYWLLCQRGQLLDLDLERCGGPFAAGCARCLATTAGEAERRLAHVRALASRVNLFFTPSQTLHDVFAAHGFPSSKLERQDQGIDVSPFGGLQRRPSPKIRVGFAGSLMASKAPHVFLQAARMLPSDAFEAHVFGAYAPYHGDDSYRARLEPAMPGIHVHGAVPHDRIAEVFAALDVLVVPSVWLENAPFVIKEAYAAGLPVVASRLGGMAELVSHEETGLLFEPGSPDALAAALLRLAEEPGLLDRLRARLPAPRTMAEDARETRAAYERLAARIAPAPMTRLQAALRRLSPGRARTSPDR